jgi:hypothetical protein
LNPVDATIMSLSLQAGVAILNQGRDHGVRIGDRFTVYRGDQFVAAGVVREAARGWAAIAFHLVKLEPRVGDHATSRLLP